ncbi:MAG: DUF4118 domain-containing protein [Acidimicrobiales bacterium]
MNILVAYVRTHRQSTAVLFAMVGPFLVSLALVPFRTSFVNTAAAMVMIALVVGVALVARSSGGVVASVSSALWFNFFLTRPYESFEISHRGDIETTVSLFVVGLIVTALAARSHHHLGVSREESALLETIRAIEGATDSPVAFSPVTDVASSFLIELLGLRACRFESQPVAPPLAQLTPSGAVEHVGMIWPVEEMGLPGPEFEIRATCAERTEGVFVLTPTPGYVVSLERRRQAALLVHTVALALASSPSRSRDDHDVEERGR